jgi:hypothetical protein
LEQYYQLPLRNCRKFIGDIGEQLVYEYFMKFDELSIESIFYQRAGFGDYGLLKKEKTTEYKKKLKIISEELPLVLHWTFVEENYPDLDKDLIEFENENVCKIDVKTSLGKFPRSTNILTPSQKMKPKYDYVLRVKLYDSINNGFIGELNFEEVENILNDPKIKISKKNIDNIVKIDIENCYELLHKIGLYLLKYYFISNNYYVEINQDIPYLVLYRSEDIKKQLRKMRISLSYIESGIDWLPNAHQIPIKYLIKCENSKQAKKMAKTKDMLNLGSFILMNKENWEPEIVELYEENPWYVWDHRRQKEDYEKMLSDYVDNLNVKITFGNHVISDYRESEIFSKNIHADIQEEFSGGFQAILKKS